MYENNVILFKSQSSYIPSRSEFDVIGSSWLVLFLHALTDAGFVAAAGGEETAACVGALRVGELLDTVHIAQGDTVRSIRETAAFLVSSHVSDIQ